MTLTNEFESTDYVFLHITQRRYELKGDVQL